MSKFSQPRFVGGMKSKDDEKYKKKLQTVMKKKIKKKTLQVVLNRNLKDGQNNDFRKSNALGSTFWMNLSDFCKYFYIMTISFANSTYV